MPSPVTSATLERGSGVWESRDGDYTLTFRDGTITVDDNYFAVAGWKDTYSIKGDTIYMGNGNRCSVKGYELGGKRGVEITRDISHEPNKYERVENGYYYAE